MNLKNIIFALHHLKKDLDFLMGFSRGWGGILQII